MEYTSDFFESAIIKLLVTSNKVRDRMIPYLSSKDDLKIFHKPESRIIVSKITDLFEKYKEFPPPSSIRLEIDSPEVLTHFEDSIKTDLSPFQEDHLLLKIENFFKENKLFNLFSDGIQKLQEGEFTDIVEISGEMREALGFSFDQNTGLNLFSDDGMEKMYEHFHNKDKVISTGLKSLDTILDGGWHEKSLHLIAASTNLGKSFLLCAFSANALLDNRKVLYITLEMSEQKIGERIIANMFDTEINNIRNIPKTSFELKYKSISETIKNNLIIKEYPARSISANNILSLLKELELKQHFIPEVVVIDYLGLMVPIRIRKDENSYSEGKRVSEEVRAVAQEVCPAILSAQQTNRSSFGASVIGNEVIADSTGPLMTADAVMLLSQSEDLKNVNQMRVFVSKNRFGPKDVATNIGVYIAKMQVYDVDAPIENFNEGTNQEAVQEADNEKLQSFLCSRRKVF